MNNNDIIRILFVSDDISRFDVYKNQAKEAINEFNGFGFPPVSFEFINSAHGAFFYGGLCSKLKELWDNCANVRVIFDSQVIKNDKKYGETVRSLILEYPEVNFFFQEPEGTDNQQTVTDWIFPKTHYEEEEKKEGEKELENKYINFPDYQIPILQEIFEEAINVIDGNIKYEDSCLKDIKFVRRKGMSDMENVVVFKSDLQKYLAKMSVDFTFHDASKIFLLLMKDNLFDASNLRNAILQWRQAEMHTKCNYENTIYSRSNYLAHVVEEEGNQCYFNSYVAFANGYRVLPICSAHLLKSVGKSKKQLIIRDYDLQFKDEIPDPSSEVNEIDKIRGYKFSSEGIGSLIDDSNKYWDAADFSKDNCVFFITYGQDGICVNDNLTKPTIEKNKLSAPGTYKPVIGIYQSHHHIPPLKERKQAIFEDTTIELSREKHLHGVPLDLYDKAECLLNRAIRYYNSEQYIYSAVLSNEALLTLNCFHTSLSLKAYHIHSISENAIALNVIGGDERLLAEDASLRCRYIRQDIERLISVNKDTSNRDNVLNQIFSDCRIFCKDKEHFMAEDVFISEMAHINDGGSTARFLREGCEFITRIFRKHS